MIPTAVGRGIRSESARCAWTARASTDRGIACPVA